MPCNTGLIIQLSWEKKLDLMEKIIKVVDFRKQEEKRKEVFDEPVVGQ